MKVRQTLPPLLLTRGAKAGATNAKCAGLQGFQVRMPGAPTSMASSSAEANQPPTACAPDSQQHGRSANAPTPNRLERVSVATAQQRHATVAARQRPDKRYSLALTLRGCAEARDSARVTPPCIGNTWGGSPA